MTYPRISARDRLAAAMQWVRVERVCTACGARVPAATVDGTGRCPVCAERHETPDSEE